MPVSKAKLVRKAAPQKHKHEASRDGAGGSKPNSRHAGGNNRNNNNNTKLNQKDAPKNKQHQQHQHQQGADVCHAWARNKSCKYGTGCRYSHP